MSIQEEKILEQTKSAGFFSRILIYFRINGPANWLALLALSAGSLVGSLGLGQYFGVGGIWIQTCAMTLGFFCLWAVSHITLNTQQTFFSLLKNDWNTNLAWLFAIAALITNFAWCMPQFRFGADITSTSLLPFLDNKPGKICTALVFLVIAILFSFWYEKSGSRSMLFQWSLRSMLLLLVGLLCLALCLLFSNSEIIFRETILNFSTSFSNFSKVHSQYHGLLELSGDMRQFWENQLLSTQRQFLLATFSSTLGINLLFAYPLLLLGRNWRRGHVNFSKFNLLTGLLIPFIICTTCLVVLSAVVSQHQISQSEFAVFKNSEVVHLPESKPVRDLLNRRIIHEIGFDQFDELAPFQQEELIQSLPPAEKHLATLSVPYGIKDWIEILNKIGGSAMRPILGVAVLLICLSSTILLMIINGHLLCEILGKPHKGALFQSGSLLLAISAVGSFVWTDQNDWVADPSYFVSLIILPFTFFAVLIILNNRDIMGRERPYDWTALLLNSGNALTIAILGSCSLYIAWNHYWGLFPVGKTLTVLISAILFGGYYSLKLKKLNNRISGLESKLKSNLKN